MIWGALQIYHRHMLTALSPISWNGGDVVNINAFNTHIDNTFILSQYAHSISDLISFVQHWSDLILLFWFASHNSYINKSTVRVYLLDKALLLNLKKNIEYFNKNANIFWCSCVWCICHFIPAIGVWWCFASYTKFSRYEYFKKFLFYWIVFYWMLRSFSILYNVYYSSNKCRCMPVINTNLKDKPEV